MQVKGEREKGKGKEKERDMDGRRECCGIRKYGREKEASEELERQEWSVKEGEVEQKMRQGEGGSGVMPFDRGGFKMGSW